MPVKQYADWKQVMQTRYTLPARVLNYLKNKILIQPACFAENENYYDPVAAYIHQPAISAICY